MLFQIGHCINAKFNVFRDKRVLDKHKLAFTLAEVFSQHSACQRKAAFTLAEVLVTLGIIGVVAAMTMPNLIAKHQEKETVTRLKKAYTIMQQLYITAVNEYGTPDN